ncbi:hypothetical protein Sru01_69120 [Sphaerisporangium rufum]|uniref:Uncharacterized protein n=1 Tax=Sphaerisporangium rufum TaxID=1381558 RepID=A0A919V919_9ACTN|nr:hypothetical protein Sru01_69120 [Sphaerisporangium rufum]
MGREPETKKALASRLGTRASDSRWAQMYPMECIVAEFYAEVALSPSLLDVQVRPRRKNALLTVGRCRVFRNTRLLRTRATSGQSLDSESRLKGRLAVWVAVQSGPGQFRTDHACLLTCNELSGTMIVRAFNPLVSSSSLVECPG